MHAAIFKETPGTKSHNETILITLLHPPCTFGQHVPQRAGGSKSLLLYLLLQSPPLGPAIYECPSLQMIHEHGETYPSNLSAIDIITVLTVDQPFFLKEPCGPGCRQ